MQKIEATDAVARSLDMPEVNIKALKQLFPDVVVDGLVDFDTLRQLLGESVAQSDEKYGLSWHGKREARNISLIPSNGTLRPAKPDSLCWDETNNLMIEGDNLEVLKLLQKSYGGKIKMIYIDPPYNTGKDFIYPDSYKDGIRNYLTLTSQVDGNGKKLTSNPETSGRFHTQWLNMMYPRLRVARHLLRDDGVIFVSVDDTESENSRLILNEVFGEENFIGTFVVVATPNGRDYGHIAKTHEYVHFYCKNIEFASTNELEVKEKVFRFADKTSGFNVHPLYNSNEAFTPENRPNLYFPIYLYPDEPVSDCTLTATSKTANCFFTIGGEKRPGSVEIYPPKSEKNGVQFVWRWGKPKCAENWNQEIIGYRTEENEFRIVQKMRHTTKLVRSLLDSTEVTTRRGTAEVEDLLGGKVASFPKPLGLLKTLIQVGSSGDDIVMDFFAGSGTTGHAVMAQNAEDGGNRRFILVQLNEPLNCGSKEQKIGADYCEKIGKPQVLTEITKERLRRASASVKQQAKGRQCDLGFRVFKLDSSNIQAWEPIRDDVAKSVDEALEHLRADRSEDDILFELLLKLGLDLTTPIESRNVGKKTVYSIGYGVLFVCLSSKIDFDDIESLAGGIAGWRKELNPVGECSAIFRDSAFRDDVAKTNLTAILSQNGIDNVSSL